jgi:hypothetical protein
LARSRIEEDSVDRSSEGKVTAPGPIAIEQLRRERYASGALNGTGIFRNSTKKQSHRPKLKSGKIAQQEME